MISISKKYEESSCFEVFTFSKYQFKITFVFVISLIFLTSCEKYYITVTRERVDRESLASTFVKSPDPLQENPPMGQKLYLRWNLPRELSKETLCLSLSIIYNNYTTETIRYPITTRRGVVVYELLNEKYFEKGGLLTYQAQITNKKLEVVKEWKQVLWVNLIQSDQEGTFSNEKMDFEIME